MRTGRLENGLKAADKSSPMRKEKAELEDGNKGRTREQGSLKKSTLDWTKPQITGRALPYDSLAQASFSRKRSIPGSSSRS